MLLVVMLEGNGQVTQRRFSIRFGHMRHVVTLEGLYEGKRSINPTVLNMGGALS